MGLERDFKACISAQELVYHYRNSPIIISRIANREIRSIYVRRVLATAICGELTKSV